MSTCNVQQLLRDASCFLCVDAGTRQVLQLQLLCEIFNNGIGGGGGTGTVTSFSSGSLSPLFTTAVTNPTTTPALAFTLSTQSANTLFAGPTSGGAAAPTFRAMVNADIPTTLTPQMARLGLGVAADASMPLYVSGPNNGANVNSFVFRVDAPTSDPVFVLGAAVNNQGMLFAYSKVNNYLFFGVYGANGMTIDGSGNVNLTGGVYKCQNQTGQTGTFDSTNTVTVTGGLVTQIS